MNMKVVDQQLFNWVALPATMALRDEMLERARRSGRHVAEMIAKPDEERTYIGDPGLCPVCHASVLELTKTSEPALCAVCGVKGTLKNEGGTYTLEVTQEERALSHILLSGKFHHAEDLKNRSLKPDPRMSEIPELIKKYKSYLEYSRPERVKAR
jgi:hypothetical protein